jgi:hypothetical protein
MTDGILKPGEHKPGSGTVATFISAEDKAAGVDAAAVAMRLAQSAQGGGPAAQTLGGRGISVQVVGGPMQVTPSSVPTFKPEAAGVNQVPTPSPFAAALPGTAHAAFPPRAVPQHATADIDAAIAERAAREAPGAAHPSPDNPAMVRVYGRQALTLALTDSASLDTHEGRKQFAEARAMWLEGVDVWLDVPPALADSVVHVPVHANPPAALLAPPAPEKTAPPLAGAGGVFGHMAALSENTETATTNRELEAFTARAPGQPLHVEFRGVMRVTTTGRVLVTHARDEDAGVDEVVIAADDEAEVQS